MRTSSSFAFIAFLIPVLGCGTSVEGDGDGAGGGGGGSGSTSSPSSSGAGGADGPLDCGSYVRCAVDLGDDAGRCDGGGSCAFLPGCLTAICIEEEEACAATCPDSDCIILESYPAQISCDGTRRDSVDDVTCDEVTAELAAIQSCTADEECGLVLEGTSCGCTRDLVARLDAPVDIFETLREAAGGCDFGSTCDCPETDGFACVEGVCSWRYVAP
jgi:hypothetical protein